MRDVEITLYIKCPKSNRPALILLANFIFDMLSIVYSDVLFSVDFKLIISLYPRANPGSVKELLPQETLLLTHVRSGETFTSQLVTNRGNEFLTYLFTDSELARG